MFWRKAFNALLEWKENYSQEYAAMLEGARRVGKSTIAEEFAKKNFKSYIKIDSSGGFNTPPLWGETRGIKSDCNTL